MCAQCRVQVAWDSRSPQRPAAAGAGSPVSLNLPARAAPLSGPHFGGAGTLPRALGEPPGGWRARRSHMKRAGDRRTLGQAGAALAAPTGLGGRGRVCIYVQCLGLCARCARGAHTCAHGPGAPWTCPFHSWSKQKRWSPLDDQTGVTREASLSSQRKRAWRVCTGGRAWHTLPVRGSLHTGASGRGAPQGYADRGEGQHQVHFLWKPSCCFCSAPVSDRTPASLRHSED